MHGLFRREIDFGILPGGMEEVALYTKGRERVFLKNRKGFIKVMRGRLTLVLDLIKCAVVGG